MLERKVPMEFEEWVLYEAQEFDQRKAVLYRHERYTVWCVIEEQVEAGERTYYATMFVDQNEYEANKVEIETATERLIHNTNKRLDWTVKQLRPIVGGVAEAYVFGDFV